MNKRFMSLVFCLFFLLSLVTSCQQTPVVSTPSLETHPPDDQEHAEAELGSARAVGKTDNADNIVGDSKTPDNSDGSRETDPSTPVKSESLSLLHDNGEVRCDYISSFVMQQWVCVNFNLNTTQEIPVFYRGQLTLRLGTPLTEDQVGNLPAALQYRIPDRINNWHYLAASIDKDTDLILPAWLTGAREATLRFRVHPWPKSFVTMLRHSPDGLIEVEATPKLTAAPGEPIGFKLNWPFQREAIESMVRELLAEASYQLYWVSNDEFWLDIEKSQGDYLYFKSCLKDIYGHHLTTDPKYLRFDIPPKGPIIVRGVNLDTGLVVLEKEAFISADTVHSLSSDQRFLTGYRYPKSWDSVYSDNRNYRRNVTYDLTTNTLVDASSWESVMSENEREQVAKATMVSLMGYEFVSCRVSPSESRLLAFNQNPDGFSVYVFDAKVGTLTNYPVVEENFPKQFADRKVQWSYDERYFIYDKQLPGGEVIVVSLDTQTGLQTQLFKGETWPQVSTVSSVSHHVGIDNAIVAFNGERGANFPGEIVAWVTSTELIVKLTTANYLVNVTNGSTSFLVRGDLFYRNLETGIAYFVEKK